MNIVLKLALQYALPYLIKWAVRKGYVSSVAGAVATAGIEAKEFVENLETYHEKSDFPNYKKPIDKVTNIGRKG